MVHRLYFLWHVKKLALPSCNHYSAFVPQGTGLNLIKRIQLTAMKKEGCANSTIPHLPSLPVPSEGETYGSVEWEVRKYIEIITNMAQVEPTGTWGPLDNNSSLHYVVAQPRVINKTGNLSKEWQGSLTHTACYIYPGSLVRRQRWSPDTWLSSINGGAAVMMFSIFPVFLRWHLAHILADHSDRIPLEVFSWSEGVFWYCQKTSLFYTTSIPN